MGSNTGNKIMASYEKISSQTRRLGGISTEFGDFGADEGVAYINAIGNAINGVVGSITRSKTLIQQSKDRRQIAITVAVEDTKKLGISTKGATEQAAIGVENVKATYGSISKLILSAGTVFAALMLAGAIAYSIANKDEGEYEIQYDYV